MKLIRARTKLAKSRFRSRRSNLDALGGDVPIDDQQDFSYLAEVQIGGQTFRLVFDTGSSDLWVVSSACTDDSCQKVPRYDPTTTLVQTPSPFSLDYLVGSVGGAVVYETVRLGRYQISAQTLGLANRTSGLDLSGSGQSGIMGLAFASEASIDPSLGQPLLDNLFAAFPDDAQKFFAFRLSTDSSASSFTVAELDPSLNADVSKFTYAPVVARPDSTYDYWKLPMRNLTIDGVTLPFSGSKVSDPSSPSGLPYSSPVAVLDTGTTLMLGPTDDVDRLWRGVGDAARKNTGGNWQVRCNHPVVVRVTLGYGKNVTEYVLDPADVNFRQGSQDGQWCLGGIQGNDNVNSGDWLLGDVFLRSVYATHHVTQPPKIGLLGMTDLAAAMANFQATRGIDTAPPVTSIWPVQAAARASDAPSTAIYAGSLAGGVLVGAGAMMLGLRAIRAGKQRR